MSILDRLEERATGMRAPNSLRDPVTAMVSSSATGNIRDYTLDANEEYELVLTLRATYWANKAQRYHGRAAAQRSLAALLYRDVEVLLGQLEHAIVDGNGKDAYHWCGKIRDLIRGAEGKTGDSNV